MLAMTHYIVELNRIHSDRILSAERNRFLSQCSCTLGCFPLNIPRPVLNAALRTGILSCFSLLVSYCQTCVITIQNVNGLASKFTISPVCPLKVVTTGWTTMSMSTPSRTNAWKRASTSCRVVPHMRARPPTTLTTSTWARWQSTGNGLLLHNSPSILHAVVVYLSIFSHDRSRGFVFSTEKVYGQTLRINCTDKLYGQTVRTNCTERGIVQRPKWCSRRSYSFFDLLAELFKYGFEIRKWRFENRDFRTGWTDSSMGWKHC